MKKDELFGTSQQNNGYVTLEEIEAAFKTPTQYQHFYDTPDPSDTHGAPDDLSHLADPDGSASEESFTMDDEREPVSPEKAQRTGMRIAKMVDTGIDFTLSNLVAKNGKSYKADERDLQDIAECWGELAQEKGWSLGPEWTLIILYVMVYGPLVKQSFTDRRMAELEARQKALEEQMKIMQIRQEGSSQPQTPANDGTTAKTQTTSPYTYNPA